MKKHMKPLTTLKTEDLVKKSKELKTEIIDLRRGIKTGDVQNTQAAKLRRRELARIKTILSLPVKTEQSTNDSVEKKKAASKTAVKENK